MPTHGTLVLWAFTARIASLSVAVMIFLVITLEKYDSTLEKHPDLNIPAAVKKGLLLGNIVHWVGAFYELAELTCLRHLIIEQCFGNIGSLVTMMLLDLGLAGALTSTAAIMAPYLPLPDGKCNVPSSEKLSYFAVLKAAMDGKDINAVSVARQNTLCRWFVAVWWLQVIMAAVHYAIPAFIFFFLMLQQPILRHLIYRKRLWQRTQWKKEFTEWEKLESERLQAGAPARALSTHEKGSTLDSARGLPGIGTDLQQPIELHGFPTHSPNAKEPQTKDGKPYEPSACDGIPPSRSGETYLIQLLGSYEIARAIALECHYSDMKSLMLVSQGLKNAVLGSLNAQMMVQLTCTNLKRNSHMDAEEVQEGAARTVGKCWNCKGKICQDCSLQHVIGKQRCNCAPLCGRCFRQTVCSIEPPSKQRRESHYYTSYWLPQVCSCYIPLCASPQALGPAERAAYPRRFECKGQDINVDVCRLCKEQLLMVHKRMSGDFAGAAFSGAGIEAQSNACCSWCGKRFSGEENVWWRCRSCQLECISWFHYPLRFGVAPEAHRSLPGS